MHKHTPNTFVEIDGDFHWISRSVAVVAVVVWKNMILITKRGPKVTATDKWCVPCGYLDWDESATQCVLRELYEETGLNLNDYEYSGLDSPYEIVTDPRVNSKQDVALHYLLIINSPTEPQFDISKTDSTEVQDIKWIKRSEIDNHDFAFNHDKRILKCLS